MSVPSTPTLATSSMQLDFDSSKTQLPLTISNAGSGTLTWSAMKDQPWIQINPTNGTNAGIINVVVSRTGLGVGSYAGTLSIASNGGNAQVGVSMMIPSPKPPVPATLNAATSITSTSLSLTWTVYTIDPNFASFKVFQDVSPGVNENSTLLTTILSSTQTNYQVSGLSPATTYYFRVFVTDASGASSGSNTVSARTDPQLGAWSSVSTPSKNFYPYPTTFAQVTDNEYWLGGGTYQYGELWHFSGGTWSKATLPDSSEYIRGLSFAASNDGWAVSGYEYDTYSNLGSIMHFNGASWSQEMTGSFYDVAVFSTANVWVGASSKMYNWNGTQWSSVQLGTGSFQEVRTIGGNQGLAISSSGQVFYYNGAGWTSLGQSGAKSGIPGVDKVGVSGTGPTSVWAVGDQGAFYYNGNIWSSYLDPNTGKALSNLYSVYVVSSNDGWAVGAGGKIYHWDGVQWKQVTSPTNSDLSRLVVGPSGSLWAVGVGGLFRYQ